MEVQLCFRGIWQDPKIIPPYPLPISKMSLHTNSAPFLCPSNEVLIHVKTQQKRKTDRQWMNSVLWPFPRLMSYLHLDQCLAHWRTLELLVEERWVTVWNLLWGRQHRGQALAQWRSVGRHQETRLGYIHAQALASIQQRKEGSRREGGRNEGTKEEKEEGNLGEERRKVRYRRSNFKNHFWDEVTSYFQYILLS